MTDQEKNSIQAGEASQNVSNTTPTAALKVLTLKRITKDHPDGTFGVLFDEDGSPLTCTIERPWANNQEGISSIPSGEYVCKRLGLTDHFPYEHFEVTNVKDRTAVLIHRGNVIEDSKGCILLVTGFAPMGTHKVGGKFSADAYIYFMQVLKGRDQFKLVIENA